MLASASEAESGERGLRLAGGPPPERTVHRCAIPSRRLSINVLFRGTAAGPIIGNGGSNRRPLTISALRTAPVREWKKLKPSGRTGSGCRGLGPVALGVRADIRRRLAHLVLSTRPSQGRTTLDALAPRRSWVEKRRSPPFWFRVPWRNSGSARSESKLAVGSSASTTAGSEAMARAIATRCCWPPESSVGLRSSRPSSPTA